MPTKKIYELILVDPVWDNWEHMGWVTDLKDAAPKFKNAVVNALVTAIDNGAVIVNKNDEKLQLLSEVVEQAVVMPDNFIQEYTGTYSSCIDRSCITIEELVDECLPGWELQEPEQYYGDFGDCECCIRGFVHEWPASAVDSLMAWEDAVDVFEKFEE